MDDRGCSGAARTAARAAAREAARAAAAPRARAAGRAAAADAGTADTTRARGDTPTPVEREDLLLEHQDKEDCVDSG
jgi:hypothetical protein